MTLNELTSAIRGEGPQGKWCTVESITKRYNVERRDAVEALKQLSMEGLGRFVVGRGSSGNFPTRLEWGASGYKHLYKDIEATPSHNRSNQRSYLDYTLPLDATSDAFLRVPRDLSEAEAERIAMFIASLAVKKMTT